MAKKTKPTVKPEKKRTKPAKPKSASGEDDTKVVSLEDFMGALMKVPHKDRH